MVDYKKIGSQIRKLRLEKGMTQEQLAESVGVGTTHVSHIETGHTIPSVQILIGIINALECSADELLCIEIIKDQPLRSNWFAELVEDCNSLEIKLITDVVIAMKDSMRRFHIGVED